MCFSYGDDELTWGPDPPLTPLGQTQAAEVGAIWQQELACEPAIPKPTVYYCSPLRRTAATLETTFRGVLDIDDRVRVRENLREKLDAHTPDKRMPMSVMRSEHPTWPVETKAVEDDIYWKHDWAESFEEYSVRAGLIVKEIFEDANQCKYGLHAIENWLINDHQVSRSLPTKASSKASYITSAILSLNLLLGVSIDMHCLHSPLTGLIGAFGVLLRRAVKG